MAEETDLRRHLRAFLNLPNLEDRVAKAEAQIKSAEQEIGDLEATAKRLRETADETVGRLTELNDEFKAANTQLRDSHTKLRQTLKQGTSRLAGDLDGVRSLVTSVEGRLEKLISVELDRLEYYQASEILQALKKSSALKGRVK